MNTTPRHFENINAGRKAARQLTQVAIYAVKKNGERYATATTHVDANQVEKTLARLHQLNPTRTFVAA